MVEIVGIKNKYVNKKTNNKQTSDIDNDFFGIST